MFFHVSGPIGYCFNESLSCFQPIQIGGAFGAISNLSNLGVSLELYPNMAIKETS